MTPAFNHQSCRAIFGRPIVRKNMRDVSRLRQPRAEKEPAEEIQAFGGVTCPRISPPG